MKINNFRGDLTGISAEKEPLEGKPLMRQTESLISSLRSLRFFSLRQMNNPSAKQMSKTTATATVDAITAVRSQKPLSS